MKFEYLPMEIAEALAKLANVTDKETIEDATGALYDIKAICENRYNADYWRVLYKLLEDVTNHVDY